MKTLVKVFVVVLCMTFVFGCSYETSKESYEEIELKNKGIEFEYNGHSYIEFRQYTGDSDRYFNIGIVHNPDCKCNNVK